MNFDQLKNEIANQVKQAREEGYKNGWNDRNNIVTGMDQAKENNFAWETAMQLVKLIFPEYSKLFNKTSFVEIMESFSPQEVSKIIENYKKEKKDEKNKLDVGDFALSSNNNPFIVIDIDGDFVHGFDAYGEIVDEYIRDVTKIDGHYNLEPVFKEIENKGRDIDDSLGWMD